MFSTKLILLCIFPVSLAIAGGSKDLGKSQPLDTIKEDLPTGDGPKDKSIPEGVVEKDLDEILSPKSHKDGEEKKPMIEGEEKKPMTDGEEKKSMTDGEETKPMIEGEEKKPIMTDGEEKKPVVDGEEKKSMIGGEEKKPMINEQVQRGIGEDKKKPMSGISGKMKGPVPDLSKGPGGRRPPGSGHHFQKSTCTEASDPEICKTVLIGMIDLINGGSGTGLDLETVNDDVDARTILQICKLGRNEELRGTCCKTLNKLCFS